MADDKILSLDELEAADGVDYVVVPIPALGGSVRLGSISSATAIAFQEANADLTTRPDATFRLIALSVVDADGVRLAPARVPGFIAALKQKGGRTTTTLLEAAMTLNAMTRAPASALKNDSGGPARAEPPIA